VAGRRGGIIAALVNKRTFAFFLVSLMGPVTTVATARVAFAQPAGGPGVGSDERAPVINDPAPDSPIDGPKKSRYGKAPPPPPPPPPPVLLPPRAAGQGWLGWNIGTGYGWHDAGPLEARNELSVESGFGFTTLGHFGAEIGVQWSERLALSLQSRSQVIPRKSTDPTRASTAKQWAHSLLARAVYLFPREGAQFFLGGVAGGGEGFRFRIDAQPSYRDLTNSDTVRGGAFIVGPVAGFILPLLEKLSVVGEARILAGLPDKAAIFEVNLGAQFDLFHL
jgi:hypothetical protein